jgi:hypothetical protein
MTGSDFMYMLSCIFGGCAAMLMVAMLSFAPKREVKPTQRAGIGIMASATLMLLPRLYMQAPTPFDPWAATLLWLGLLVFFSGSGYRAIDHAIRGEVHARRGVK